MSVIEASLSEIIRWIRDSAIIHDDRCTWIGAVPLDPLSDEHRRFCSLGPDLYGGSAGVALFLGEAAATCREAVADLARAALTHAFATSAVIEESARLGLYAGLSGVLLAASRLAQLCPEAVRTSELDDLTAAVLQAVGSVDGQFDLMSGAAGGIIGLLGTVGPEGAERRRTGARRLADWLISTAIDDGGTMSWPPPEQPRHLPLTGLSHGTSGPGWALAELAAATGDDRYATAAQRCFAYERRWFSSTAGNWPDLREIPRSGRPRMLTYPARWCHGSAGIALVRLRCADLLADDDLRSEAVTAVETTKRAVETMLDTSENLLTLCHGLAGNADVLLTAASVLGDDSPRKTAQQVADHLATLDLPAVLAGDDSDTPGLFLGISGVGYFLLRMLEPTVPSVLLPVSTIDGLGSEF